MNIITRIIIFTALTSFVSFHASAQKKAPVGKQTKSMVGTYQIFRNMSETENPKQISEAFTTDLINDVLIKNRHKTKVTYYEIGKFTKVKILPYSEINSPTFKPVSSEELIY
jgi:hypothetical protein